MKHLSFLTHTSKEGWKPFLSWDPSSIYKGQNVSDCISFIQKENRKGRSVVGYIAFNTGYKLLNIKQRLKDNLGIPNLYFLSYKENKIKEIEKVFTKNIKLEKKTLQLRPSLLRNKYFAAFKKTKEYIADGHIYQINLTQQLKGNTSLSGRKLFEQVMQTNEAGYMVYIEGDGFEVLSASPEHFLKTKNRIIETWPIKGTRPRGKTAKEDNHLQNELLTSEKEQAELDMITDLMRNDLGRVCEFGSIAVLKRRTLTKFPTLFHASSHIRGTLKKEITPIEALFSIFPGGSVTGVPKKRAMEIIDQLETTQRGVYCGAIGIIDPSGDIDFNIAIRTLIKKGNEVYLSVGGGIVYDSDAELEYQETFDKAKTFI